ncbi:MAG TPA: hypothetical protein VFO16_05350 [Pseudonocardiaceae bacterium]|nr:hypothetical protein [Pseudonocardiaceae bacterium]
MARFRFTLMLAAAAFATVGVAGPAAADPYPPSVARPTAPAPYCHVIDFESAQVITSPSEKSRYLLVVRGEKPSSNTQVTLNPLVYIRQPEYWGIEVVGCVSGIGLPVLTPYTATLDLDGVIGTRGIAVIGSTHSETIDVPGGPAPIPDPKSSGSR